jgi:hypothetical protein
MGLGLGVPLVHLQPKWLPARWTASTAGGAFRDLHAWLPSLSVVRVMRALRELVTERART